MPRLLQRGLSLAGATAALGAGLLATGQFAAGAAGTQDSVPTVAVTITDSKLTLRPASAPVGSVVFEVADQGSRAHVFTVGGKQTLSVPPGKSTVLKVAFTKGGNYPAIARSTVGKALKAVLTIHASPASILPSQGTTTVTTTTTTTATGGTASCPQPASTTVTVTIVPPKFTFSQTTLPCGSVTFVVTNNGTVTHSLQINAPIGVAQIPRNPAIQPGQTVTITVDMRAKGVYGWLCGERDDAADEGEYGNLSVQ